MMKKFAFLLVCLVFSSSIIGMARAADEENGGTGGNGETGGAGENGGTGENQTTTTTTEAPDVTTKNGTVEKVTDAPVIVEGPNTTTTTTTTEKVTTGSGSAG